MVMEAPSAQCVGREFVRQYYTLLHEAPDYLHRFYSHNSCFVHGGVEKPGEEQPPVQGQSDIHRKILSLNFRDCHAKIRQVDSQATVGSAVVVQVTGELSNAGQPMRRFMQTFVLAPQSPKKYYVHNDIFRYQDEVFHDSDNDTETQEETVDSEAENVAEPEGDSVQDNTVSSVMSSFTYEGTPQPDTMPPLSNGSAAMATNVDERPETPEAPTVQSSEEPSDINHEPAVEYEQSTEQVEEVSGSADVQEEQTYIPEPQPQENKPKTWAMMAGRNTTSGHDATIAHAQKPVPQQQQQPAQIQKSAPRPSPAQSEKRSDNAAPTGDQTAAKPPREPRDQRPPRRNDPNRPERDSSRSGGGGGGADQSDDFRRSRFPDSQQVFVGNLPHNVSDKELKEQFEEYGPVLEVRINRKGNRTDLPNFGFVVFDNSDAVIKVLRSKPISTRDGHRLNVEEKKQRGEQTARPGSGASRGGRGGMGGRGSGGMDRGPPRSDRGGRGGGGMRSGSDMRGGSSSGGSDRGGRGGGGGYGGPRR